ncbi:MAG TPA: PIG-L family deacetylase [Opitutaceae bacterium]|nr:PIG-L family deacetylase [Opitutaceae bacterium]
MIVLAHPDDETIGATTVLLRASIAAFVYVTDGAPQDMRDARAAGCATREDYANRRRGELLSVLECAGIPEDRVEFVGIVDQEVSAQLATLTRWIEILIREHRPEVVLTHPYEGGHPDHDATAFSVHAAIRRIAASGGCPPLVAEFTSYHDRNGERAFGEFLHPEASPVVTRMLTPRERTFKRRLFGCYATQQHVLAGVATDIERFRIAPAYDFTQPPHPGLPLYERHSWGLTLAQWQEQARSALDRLGLSAHPCDHDPAPVACR